MPPEFEYVRWARLEPRSRDKSLAPGLEARVHDPLWLLGRQWQFGELNADGDLGSAIVAEVSASVASLSRYRPGRMDEPSAAQAYDVAAQPLETLVAKGTCVTVIGFREYANFALISEVIEFVDLEEIDGVFREPLPRMTLETLPDSGAWLPPFRSLRSLLEPRR